MKIQWSMVLRSPDEHMYYGSYVLYYNRTKNTIMKVYVNSTPKVFRMCFEI